ncbi:S-adenosyl-L-methionine-dependent methyltransferase [Aspergillus pseudodeflectus]|uniref:S-adenosyl-L-methionine-dependent methyltransferase n=1 Tax=Aspergillus pseudodeflectus TaxID=176178 RepID=A0ABR4KWX6_9EURO
MASDGLLEKVNALEAQLQNVKSLLTSHNAEANGSASPASDKLAAARLELLELANNLEYAALGPTEWLKASFAVTKYDHLAYYTLSQFPIHEHIPLTGSITYDALSTASGMPPSPLKRVLRHLMLNHLFTEPKPGHVAHSEASRILVTEPGMTSWMEHNYDEVFRSFGFFPEALKRGSSGVADDGHPGKTATALAFAQPNGFFGGLLAEEPWRAKRFAEAMQAMTRGSHDHSHLANGYDWGRFGGGLVVDVGGSSGFQSIAIATAHPELRFVVQDIEDLSTKLEENISTLAERPKITFQVHDFFKPNPETSADVYFLRHIIHDWSDSYASKILRNIASVMKPSARIVIMDIVVPEKGVLPFLDLQMMVVVNGKERNRQEWDELLALADPRLRILSVKQPQYSVASIIEIGLVE